VSVVPSNQTSQVWVFQAPERPGPRDHRTDYRRGFYEYVTRRFPLSQALLLEPDPLRYTELRELWDGHPNTEIVQAVWCEQTQCSGEHQIFQVRDPNNRTIYSENASYVQRFAPDSVPASLRVSCRPIPTLEAGSTYDLMSIDIAEDTQWRNIMRGRKVRPAVFAITTQDVSVSKIESVRNSLAEQGYVLAGRCWGSAESGLRLVLPRSIGQYLSARGAQSKVQVGTRLVEIRDRLPIGERFTALKRRVVASFDLRHPPMKSVDASFGLPLPPMSRAYVEDVIDDAQWSDQTFEIELRESNPDDVARECHEELGIFPMSFSHPDVYPLRQATRRLSAIIPGFPYTFHDEATYMNYYASCQLAVTHRKAGWDCFRHVEIGASGAIPLMVDADEIPRYAMVHYPKSALIQIKNEVIQGKLPGPGTKELLRRHFTNHQTTRTMAEYMLRMSNLEDVGKILFVDGRLPKQADYLSALSLIGLKQLFGRSCEVLFPTPYLYSDNIDDRNELYGRGFGYAHKLEPDSRSPLERDDAHPPMSHLDLNDYDAIVIGSYYRNADLVPFFMSRFPRQQILVLYGEDTPPTRSIFRQLQASGMHTFMRPIHSVEPTT